MRFLYDFLIRISWIVLHLVALFNSKINLFVKGRKRSINILKTNPLTNEKVIWMHVASLGEYEQGLPILEMLKSNYPSYKIVLTFFSPSGYEVKKDSTMADLVLYLPMDTSSNSKRFIQTFQPAIAIFVKYEIWPNYFSELQKHGVPTFLISAIFSKRQAFFKWYGGFMRKSLDAVSHFFVQNTSSKALLESIGYQNISVSGDTRFDRVTKILSQDNRLNFLESFKGNGFCMVAGSTWPEDEAVMIPYINSSERSIKYVIAPHNIKPAHIEELKNSISKKTICYSEIEGANLEDFEVLIVDTIGLLTKIYSYAEIAYVGGGFETGLHNTLEPAVFGIPVIIGPNYEGFQEAEDMVRLKGVHVVTDIPEFENLMNKFVADDGFRERTGAVNSSFVDENGGASSIIFDHIKTFI